MKQEPLSHVRSEEELRQASNWLIYEIWMVKGLAKALQQGELNDLGVVSNAVIDSFLIHVRALLSFFYPEGKPHKDDVLAEHYLSMGESHSAILPQIAPILKDAKKRINKSLAHISYNRQKSAWESTRIAEDLEDLIDKFLALVPLSLLGSRWNEYKQKGSDINTCLPPFDRGDSSILKSSFYSISAVVETDWYPEKSEVSS